MSWLGNKLKTALFFLKRKKVIVFCRAFYGDEWMRLALKSVEPYVDKILIITSDKSWGNSIDKPDDIDGVYNELKKESDKYCKYKGEWDSQVEQQNDALNFIREHHKECTHLLFLDTDEIYEEKELLKLMKLIKSRATFNQGIRVKMYTYIKSVYYRVYPQEVYMPIAIIPIRDYIRFSDVRQTTTCPIHNSNVNMHHFSLVRKSDERIKVKFNNRAKSYKRVEQWYENYYENFNVTMKNFHPIKGNENQWAEIEIVKDHQLPKGVVEEYKKWHEFE